MAKSHCTCTIVSRVAKSCVLYVKLLQESISVSLYENNDISECRTLTHNHNRLMGTITFEVHHITLTSPRNMLATIYKSILILFAFSCSLHILFLSKMKHIMHGHIREKEIPVYFNQASFSCCSSAILYRARLL